MYIINHQLSSELYAGPNFQTRPTKAVIQPDPLIYVTFLTQPDSTCRPVNNCKLLYPSLLLLFTLITRKIAKLITT